MNQEQMMSLLRTGLQIFGTMLMSYHLFGIDTTQWAAISGAVLMAAPAVWGVVTNRKASQVAKVNAMPEVKGVVTTNTTEGIALANAVPTPAVAPAGTEDAKRIAA